MRRKNLKKWGDIMRTLFLIVYYKILRLKINHNIKLFRKKFVKVLIGDNRGYAAALMKALSFKDRVAVLYASNCGYDYLARNKSGRLYAYTELPERVSEIWKAPNKISTPIQADIPFLTFNTEPLYINLRNLSKDCFTDFLNCKKTKIDITDFFKEHEIQKKSYKDFFMKGENKSD